MRHRAGRRPTPVDVTARLARVRVPALVLHYRDDRLILSRAAGSWPPACPPPGSFRSTAATT